MSTNANPTPAKYQDARALPAPPIALWAFVALLVSSVLWAALNL